MPGSGTSHSHYGQQHKPKEKTQRWGTGGETAAAAEPFVQIIREEDEDQDTNQLQQLLGGKKRNPVNHV